jgi:hypothetical protein
MAGEGSAETWSLVERWDPLGMLGLGGVSCVLDGPDPDPLATDGMCGEVDSLRARLLAFVE